MTAPPSWCRTASTDSAPLSRRFGFTLGPALLVVAAVAWWRAALGAAQGGAAIGHLLGRVSIPVFFTLLWIVAFVPMGIARYRLSRSPLARQVFPDVARTALERQF